MIAMNDRKDGTSGKAMKPGKATHPGKDSKTSAVYYVKDLGERLGVSIKTIKKWEQEKKIPKARRNVFDWRIYTEAELDRVEEIVRKNNYFKHNNRTE